jgi:hypothetical protein
MSPFSSLPRSCRPAGIRTRRAGSPTRQVRRHPGLAADPAAILIVSPAFSYAGGQTIDILKVAGAEQYFFIDAAPDRSIHRFVWIQFSISIQQHPHLQYAGIKTEAGDARPPHLHGRCQGGPELFH